MQTWCAIVNVTGLNPLILSSDNVPFVVGEINGDHGWLMKACRMWRVDRRGREAAFAVTCRR